MNRHWQILISFFSVFLITLIGFFVVGWVPEEMRVWRNVFFDFTDKEKISREQERGFSQEPEKATNKDDDWPDRGIQSIEVGNLPSRIIIPKIGVDAPVVNPESRDVTVLDQALLTGAVRYPFSGLPGGDKPIFIFGHSTTFPVVRNEAYKTFNRLEDLNIGDELIVRAGVNTYYYQVFAVELADENTALIELKDGERILVLSTCNTFGAKSERIVVRGKFVKELKTSRI
jgi:LPXTG-site transpeptidase (sortase) family protein